MGAAIIPFAQAFVYGAAAGASAAAVAGAALGAIAQIALINAGLGFLSKKLAGNPDRPPMNVTYSGPTVPRRCLYGRRRCFGSFVYSTLSSSGGSRNDYLWLVVALVDHQCHAIDTIWIDGEKVEPSQINSSGMVISGKFAQKLSIWKHLGTSGQTADANLVGAVPSEWTWNHRLQGVTYLVLRCKTDDEAWAQGPPQAISALVSGALCYDPRLDSTNGGSGTQRAGDPSTWTFTRNPILHARHYLTGGSVVNDTSVPLRRYGLKDPDSRIEDADIIAAANICDESMPSGYGIPGDDNIRYQCDLEFEATRTRREVLEAILETCAGAAYPDKGKWRFFAGAYETPTHTLTQDDLYGPLKIRDTSGHEERFNAVSAILDQCDDMDYVEHTTVFQTNATFEAADGGERIPLTLELEGVTNQYQAQRLAYIKQLKSRLWRRLEWTGSRALLRVRRGETVLVSHSRYGWVNHVYRCIERQFIFSPERVGVVLTLEREDPASYTELNTEAYETGINPTPVFMIDGPATPFTFTAAPMPNGIQFSWAITPGEQPFSTIYELWEHSSPTPFSAAVKIWEGSGFNYTLSRNDLSTKYYWIRARTLGNQYSGTNPSASGIPGRAATKWEQGNALNLSAWRIGSIAGGVPGEVGNFSVIQSQTGENEIVLAGTGSAPAGPRNRSIPLWVSRSVDAAGSTPDGGWQNAGDCYGIDHLKTYRSVVWFRYSGTPSGNFYHGFDASRAYSLGGAALGSEAFFMARPLSDFEPDKWYVSVGFIHGSGYGSTASGQGGVYDLAAGRKVYSGTDYKSIPGALQQDHRAFMRNCANGSLRLYMGEPRFDEVNGNEPSLLEMIGVATTGLIPAGAATLVYYDEADGVSIVSSSISSGANLASFDLSGVEDLPSFDVVVTVTGIVEVDASGIASTFVAYCNAQFGASAGQISNDDSNEIVNTTGTGEYKTRTRFTLTDRFNGASPGVLYVNANCWASGSTSFTANVYGCRIVVEVIKR